MQNELVYSQGTTIFTSFFVSILNNWRNESDISSRKSCQQELHDILSALIPRLLQMKIKIHNTEQLA